MQSVLDVGCGTGTWLKVFRDSLGLFDILGLDGSYLDRGQLEIEESMFMEWDLRHPFDLGRGFDLVICLEVAEHLPESSAADLVDSLCRHSNRILFSAAIPGQGGQNHLNEQWSEYWQAHFLRRGYNLVDAVRPKIWNEEEVDIWYRQNIFLFLKQNDLQVGKHSIQMAEIHPELWRLKIEALSKLSEEVEGFDEGNAGIQRSFKALVNAIRNKLWGR